MRKTCIILFLSIGLVSCHFRSSSDVPAYPQRLAVTSATHIGFLSELGALDRVVAVCNKQLIYTPLPDSIIDLGDAMSPNLESLVLAHVDAVLVCSYAGSRLEQQLSRLGIRSIPIDEWKEPTPLGRSAWIKILGRELGCEAKADSIYLSVAERYDQLVAGTAGVLPHAPSSNASSISGTTLHIMTGSNYRGTWYVPSGQSYMGKLFQDAGYAYPYYDDARTGSIPLTLETCILQFRDADIWVGSEARTLNELRSTDDKHTWFKAYQTGQIYNWLGQSTPQGANNFWERGVVHPEEILEDLIRIRLHQTDSLHFAKKLTPEN